MGRIARFQRYEFCRSGLLNFTPGVGNTLTIGAGNGGLGALISNMLSSPAICGGGNCAVTGGYATLLTGSETSGSRGGGAFSYTFGAGGTFTIIGGIAPLGIANGSTLLTFSFLPGSIFSGFGAVGLFSGNVNLSSIMLNPLLNAAIGTHSFTGASNFLESISLNGACQTGGKCFGALQVADPTCSSSRNQLLSPCWVAGCLQFGAGLRRKMVASS